MNINAEAWLRDGLQWNLPDTHLSFCDIPLNGGATWTHHLIELSGKTRAELIKSFKETAGNQIHSLRDYLRKEVYKIPKNRTLNDQLKMIFVRNPLSRLVSG